MTQDKYRELKEIKSQVQKVERYLRFSKSEWDSMKCIMKELGQDDTLGTLPDPSVLDSFISTMNDIIDDYNKRLQHIREVNPEIQRAIRLCEMIGVELNEEWSSNYDMPRRINEDGTMEYYDGYDWYRCDEDLDDVESGDLYPVDSIVFG